MPTAYLSPSQLQDLTNVSSTAPGSGQNGYPLVWNQSANGGAGQWEASSTFTGTLTGSATSLAEGKTISATGDISWTSGTFNGTANVTGVATIANNAVGPTKLTDSGVTAGSYTNSSITVDAKGRITAASSGTLGTMASQNANSVAITGGTAQNLTAVSQFANNGSSTYQNSVYSESGAGAFSHAPGFQGLRARGTNASPAGVLAGDRLFALTGIPRATATNWSPAGTGFFVVANQDGSAAPSSGDNAFRVACRIEFGGVGLNNVQTLNWMTLNGTTTAVNSTNPSTSTSTGAFTVAGGAGIAGALHVGGQINGLGAVQPGTVASPTAAGTQWQVRVDENYIYVCTQTGTQGNAAWKRVAISTWTP